MFGCKSCSTLDEPSSAATNLQVSYNWRICAAIKSVGFSMALAPSVNYTRFLKTEQLEPVSTGIENIPEK